MSSLLSSNTATQSTGGHCAVISFCSMMAEPSKDEKSNTNGKESDEDALMGIPEPIKVCIRALEASETDTEKFAALFLVPKLIKGDKCDGNARRHLVQAVGYSFLARMLRSKDSLADGTGTPLLYKSVALSVLSCFTSDIEIMTNPSVLFNLPILLDIISDADNEEYEDNLLIISDAYQCIMAIASTEKGQKAFISNRGIHYLCNIYIKQTFQCEDALKLLLHILRVSGFQAWEYHNGTDDFNALMLKLCSEFESNMEERKFELCDTIRSILRSFPKNTFEDEQWLTLLQKGLHDILFSRISKRERDPAMMLVASVIEVSDFEWCIDEASQVVGNDNEGRGKFFLIIVNLACIEVLMHLEEQKLDEIVKNSELLIACYYIVESAVSYMASDRLFVFDQRQRDQLYTALKNGFSTILNFLNELSNEVNNNPSHLDSPAKKYFVCATIRVLGAWLSEETMAMREDVYLVLPFILKIATETFESQKFNKLSSLPGKGTNVREFLDASSRMKNQEGMMSLTAPDTLRFLLPALCHLVVEEQSRTIIMKMNVHETLYTYLSYHWSIFDSYKKWLEEQQNAEETEEVLEPFYMIENAKFEMVNSKYAITTICNILMNLIVLEPKFAGENPLFFHILKFIMNTLPTLENVGELLVLYANQTVLGLLTLKHHYRRPKSTDFSIFRYIQSVVRFLWDAHNCEESGEEEELVVSTGYLEHWSDLMDLWFLGMQVLSSILQQLPWIVEFILESGWAHAIVRTLSKVKRGSMDANTKSAFEDFLCCLVRAQNEKEVSTILKENGIVAVCMTHQLNELGSLICNL